MPESAKKKRLRDSYRFPGFHPSRSVRGLFGGPRARGIALTRRSKKRRAVTVKLKKRQPLVLTTRWHGPQEPTTDMPEAAARAGHVDGALNDLQG